MKNMKRAVRRQYYRRSKLKWFNRLKHCWCFASDISDEIIMKWACSYTRTRCPCSCHGCGNLRRYEGYTLQEHKNLISFSEQMLNVSVIDSYDKELEYG